MYDWHYFSSIVFVLSNFLSVDSSGKVRVLMCQEVFLPDGINENTFQENDNVTLKSLPGGIEVPNVPKTSSTLPKTRLVFQAERNHKQIPKLFASSILHPSVVRFENQLTNVPSVLCEETLSYLWNATDPYKNSTTLYGAQAKVSANLLISILSKSPYPDGLNIRPFDATAYGREPAKKLCGKNCEG